MLGHAHAGGADGEEEDGDLDVEVVVAAPAGAGHALLARRLVAWDTILYIIICMHIIMYFLRGFDQVYLCINIP